MSGRSGSYENDDVLELDPAARLRVHRPEVGASGVCSSASSNSKTRSADAMPDWNTLTIDATCVSGWVNWREYWMNAWMSPMVIAPFATRSPPTTAIATKLRLPMNIIAGWITPEMNCAPKLAS